LRDALFNRPATGDATMTGHSKIAGDTVAPDLAELRKERALGGLGATKARDVPRIDLSDFDARKAEIADQLWLASTDIGFFQLVNHSIPQAQIDEAFAMTERFFALPHDIKAQYPLGKGTNAGWEYKKPGTAFDRHARPEGIVSDHHASHGKALAERKRGAGLQGGNACV
jgi:isopenicillin N synthase-like dioxygenase